MLFLKAFYRIAGTQKLKRYCTFTSRQQQTSELSTGKMTTKGRNAKIERRESERESR